jgi:hypothetical protein
MPYGRLWQPVLGLLPGVKYHSNNKNNNNNHLATPPLVVVYIVEQHTIISTLQ